MCDSAQSFSSVMSAPDGARTVGLLEQAASGELPARGRYVLVA
jgi:hypothetical protein